MKSKKASIEAVLFGLAEDADGHLILTDEVGEGEVHVGRDFQQLPSLQQADLLNDWVEKLQDMYESVVNGDFLSDMGGTGINEPPASGSIN